MPDAEKTLKEILEKMGKCECQPPTVQGSFIKCLLDSIVEMDGDISEWQKLKLKDALLECVKEKLCVELNNVKASCDVNGNVSVSVFLTVMDTFLGAIQVINEILHEMKAVMADVSKVKK